MDFLKIMLAQSKMKEVQEQIANSTFSETEQDVTVHVTGAKHILGIELSDAFYTLNKEDGQAMIMEAINNAFEKAEIYSKEKLSSEVENIMPGGMSALKGMDLGGLMSGLFK